MLKYGVWKGIFIIWCLYSPAMTHSTSWQMSTSLGFQIFSEGLYNTFLSHGDSSVWDLILIIKPSNLHWTIGSLVNCNFYVTAFRCKFLPDYLHTIYFTNFKLLSIYITIDQMDFFCIPSSYSLEILLILKYFELVFKNMYIFWKSWCNVIWFNMFWFCWRN